MGDHRLPKRVDHAGERGTARAGVGRRKKGRTAWDRINLRVFGITGD